MMNRETLTRTMGERELKLSEILSHGFALLSNRFGRYLLLSVLVYLPINLMLQYFSMTADYSFLENVDPFNVESLAGMDMTPVVNNMLRTVLSHLGAEFLALIAVLVVAVIVKNQLFDPKNHSFGTSFYRGIRMWPRAALSLILVLIQMVLALMAASVFMMVPLIGLVSVAVVVFVAIRFSMYENLTGAVAALRGRLGFDNLRYIRFLTQKRFFRIWGCFAVLTLISNGIMLALESISMNLLLFSENMYVQGGIAVALSTFLSILNIFSFVCGTLILFNMEELKKTELENIRRNSPNDMERSLAGQTLEAMDYPWDEEEAEDESEEEEDKT